jgi:transposase
MTRSEMRERAVLRAIDAFRRAIDAFRLSEGGMLQRDIAARLDISSSRASQLVRNGRRYAAMRLADMKRQKGKTTR